MDSDQISTWRVEGERYDDRSGWVESWNRLHDSEDDAWSEARWLMQDRGDGHRVRVTQEVMRRIDYHEFRAIQERYERRFARGVFHGGAL